MKLLLITAVLLSFALSKDSFSAELHLLAKGQTAPEEVGDIYQCLALQGCNFSTFTIEENSLQITTSKSLAQVRADLRQCDLTTVKLKSLEYQDDQNEWKPIDLDTEVLRPNYLSPGILGQDRLDQIPMVLFLIQNQLLSTALETIQSVWKIDSLGYEATFVDNFAGAVTDHQKKTVQFLETATPDAAFIEQVAHEFTHAQQMKLSDSCRPVVTTFTDHDRRERAATLETLVIAHHLENHGYNRTELLRYLNKHPDSKANLASPID